jgi:hypothetical protein
LLFLSIIFTFETTKKSSLKTGPQINISESVFRKPDGFAGGLRICWVLGKQERIEKKCNNFGVLNS